MPEDKKFPPAPQHRAVPLRTYVFWIAIIGLIPLLVILRDNASRANQLSQYEFMLMLDKDLIAHATITLDAQSPYLREVRGRYFKVDARGKTVLENDRPVQLPFYAQVFLSDQNLQALVARPNFRTKRPNALLINLVWSLAPILLIALLIYFVFIRQIKLADRGTRNTTPPIVARERQTAPNHFKGIVESDPKASRGVVFAGTTVPLQDLIDAIERGESINDFLNRFPSVKREQVIAVVEAGKLKMLEAIEES